MVASAESSKSSVKAHMIGHSHIDLIWLWPWEESVQVARSTWQSVLDRMDENPDIRYVQTSAAAYKWIEDIDPVNVSKARSFYAIPFGFIERETNGHENPGGSYTKSLAYAKE